MLLKGILLAVIAISTTFACKSVSDYTSQCQSCVSQLVNEWKANPKGNCSMQYQVYKQCLTTAQDTCLRNITTDRRQRIHRIFKEYTNNKEFFCKNGMFAILTKNQRSSLGSICSAKLFRRAAKCENRYKQRFARNRGSKAACRWFYKARQCMLKAIKRNCQSSKMTSYLVAKYAHPYNPYCKGSRDKAKPKGSPGYGQCTKKSYTIKSRQCIAEFIKRLQRNNGHQCRAIVNSALIPCVSTRIKRCLRGTRDAKSLDDALKKSMARRRTVIQNKYCEGSFLETLPLSGDQCPQEYFETFQERCYTPFLIKYKQNRANPKLCRHYAEVNRCARNMTLSMCKLDQSMKDAVHFLYGTFNPFCPDARDPPDTSHHTQHEQQRTFLKNTGTAHVFSVLTLVLSILTLTTL